MAEIIIKKKIEEVKEHAFEKKVLEREQAKGEPRIDLFYQHGYVSVENMNLGMFREDMKRVGKDITTEEIETDFKVIKVKDHMINVGIYRKQQYLHQKQKAVLFIHGGGFFGGDVKTKENQCKYLAEQSDAVVISPEYRLAPECPYPGALEDVMGCLDWMTEHAQELKIDADCIAVMGESAGGTLAANCCLQDEKNRIKQAIYVYGAFDLAVAEDTPYHWDYSMYQMDEGQKDYIMNRLFRFKELTEYMEKLYVQDGRSMKDGDISPLYAEDYSKMPKTLVIAAEFDYFRICNEKFVQKMREANKEVEVVFYEGLDHGFFDRIGSLPQTADCIEEAAKRIRAMQ